MSMLESSAGSLPKLSHLIRDLNEVEVSHANVKRSTHSSENSICKGSEVGTGLEISRIIREASVSVDEWTG